MYDELIEERKNRAEAYHARTRSQLDWYGVKAGRNKRLFQFTGISIVVLGAVVGVIPLAFEELKWSYSDLLISLLGASIVILKGVERIWLPQEKWMSYRKASEALHREQERYVECLAPYNVSDEDSAYKLFVERCILIKAEEQNNFWGLNEEKTNQSGKPTQSD